MLVNRDAGFLALLGLSLEQSEPRWHESTCCNPFAGKFGMVSDHPAVMHAAAVSVCGLAVKLDDDIEDEGPVRGALAQMGKLISRPAEDHAIARLNNTDFPTERVRACLGRQSAVESQSAIEADGPTAEAFGEITAHLARLVDQPSGQGSLNCERRLRELGRSLGSLVYWRDAWDDRRKDAARGRFNPFQEVSTGTIQARVTEVWNDFGSALEALPLVRHETLFQQLQLSTQARHSSFLGIENALSSASSERGKVRRSQKSRRGKSSIRSKLESCCDSCSCCNYSSSPGKACGDACCDCGPTDSGCCDCCPCDGC